MRDVRYGWSGEFRAWLTAYLGGLTGPELDELDRAAGEAAERLRNAAFEPICPTCGQSVRRWRHDHA